MAYSMHGHISYILEPNSKRFDDFSLIGRKPNETLQFKWKKAYGIKFKTKIKFKSHAEGNQNNKNNEREYKQKGINTSKSYISSFAYNQTRNIDVLWRQNNPR